MRPKALVVAVAALSLAVPAAADAAPKMPRQKALDAYSAAWHACKKAAHCDAPRNLRRDGRRFKWVSQDGQRRHWGHRQATAAEISGGLRAMRNDLQAPPGWAIPTYIVMCESHGTNQPPNGAGASGYYQIIVSTWINNGGGRFAPQAYLATKRQQDIIAGRIWRSGGPSQWDCA